MKKLKSKPKSRRLVSLLLILLLVSTMSLSVSAAGTYVGVDDDDAQGHSNDSYGTWSRVYSSNLRYGEGLITTCTTYNGNTKYYDWIFKTAVPGDGEMGITLSVWLYHSQFNDPAAAYHVYKQGYVYQRIGTVNQNTAPAGWTDFPYVTLTCNNASGVNICQYIRLKPSTRGSSYTCGADWVEATIYP